MLPAKSVFFFPGFQTSLNEWKNAEMLEAYTESTQKRFSFARFSADRFNAKPYKFYFQPLGQLVWQSLVLSTRLFFIFQPQWKKATPRQFSIALTFISAYQQILSTSALYSLITTLYSSPWLLMKNILKDK